MSYIITSNTSDVDTIPLTVGINRPFSYSNSLSGGITVPPNSQIALESIKLNKEGNVSINRANNQFYVYYGTELSDTVSLEDTVNHPAMAWIEPKTGNQQGFNPEEFDRAYETSLKKAIYHPNLQVSNINVSGVQTSIKRDASNVFEGWSASFTCNSSASNATDTSNGWQPWSVFDINSSNYEAGSGGLISNKNPNEQINLIQEDSPLSLTGGDFHFQFNSTVDGGAVEGTAVGLTRCTRTSIRGVVSDEGIQPSYFNAKGDVFYDYVIECVRDPLETTASHVLKLYHAVKDESDITGQTLTMKEFDYRVNASSDDTDTGYFTCDNTGGADPWIAKVFFTISNEQVKVVLQDYEGEEYTLCTGTNANKLNSMKAVGMSTWHLFPKITIPPAADASTPRFMKMLKWEGVQITGYNYGSLSSPVSGNYTNLNQDWWANQVNLNKVFYCQNVDTRPAYNFASGASNYTQKGLSGGGIQYFIVLIVRQDRELYKFTVGANAGNTLGFGKESVIDSTFYTSGATALLRNIQSTNTPNFVSTNSLFVRVGNLTQKSHNMAKSSNSQIIYHMPRFENSGSEFGGLFFSPAERVYLDLQNPNEILINSLNIDIVNSDETLATNITGKTVCCLHIKQK
tara:strand:+ start:3719 stop:5605 length:1887 start_codon:yes stop_codon:yes gene_type:complete